MQTALEQLTPLVGTWRMETSLGPAAATAVFEWGLGGRILIQRTEIDIPEAPDAFCVIAPETRTGGFTQHYFDSRGVNRLYAMTFDDGVWTLLRQTPDFSPLEFSQRFTGRLEDGGTTIRGRWDSRPLGSDEWQLDFELTYLREGRPTSARLPWTGHDWCLAVSPSRAAAGPGEQADPVRRR